MFLSIISLLLHDSKLWIDIHPVWRVRLGWTDIRFTTVAFIDFLLGSSVMHWFPKCGPGDQRINITRELARNANS